MFPVTTIPGISPGSVAQATYAGVTTGTGSAYVVAGPSGLVLATGVQIRVSVHASNTVTAPTLNAGGTGAKKIFASGGGALTVGDLATGESLTLTYDAALDTGAGGWMREDVAGMGNVTAVAPIANGGTAGGSANALTATVASLSGTTVPTGTILALKMSASNTGTVTLAVNGGSAIAVVRAADEAVLATGDLISGRTYLFCKQASQWLVFSTARSGDVPSTLLPALVQFPSANTAAGAANERNIGPYGSSGTSLRINVPVSDALYLTFGGNQGTWFTSGGVTTNGSVVASGTIQSNSGSGILSNLYRNASSNLTTITAIGTNPAGIEIGNSSASNASGIRIYLPLLTKANSTNYYIGPFAANSRGQVELFDSLDRRAVAYIAKDGTITFSADSHADYVNSASPASDKVGVHVLSNAVYIQPGSAATRKIGALYTYFPEVGG